MLLQHRGAHADYRERRAKWYRQSRYRRDTEFCYEPHFGKCLGPWPFPEGRACLLGEGVQARDVAIANHTARNRRIAASSIGRNQKIEHKC